MQLKEWRFDRLKAHALREGWFRPVFGTVRPAVTGALLLAHLLLPALPSYAGIATLTALAALELAMNRIRMPVWTSKALAVVCVALVADCLVAFGLPSFVFGLLLLPVLQPFVIAMSVILLLPLDSALKRRIFARAQALRSAHPETLVIGVAGSVGKTTTKELLTCILTAAKATPAHVNTEMGVAQWMTHRFSNSAPQQMIVEMGAYKKGEIALLSAITHPAIGILTALGRDHLSLFGSADAIRDANTELLAALPADGTAIVNGDDAACMEAAKSARCTVVAVRMSDAFDITEDDDGIRFAFDGTAFSIPLHGRHNVMNALLAIAAARAAGTPPAASAERLRGFRAMAHTFNVRNEAGCTVLDDTYNSSPESVRAAILWARDQSPAPKVLLTSGVMELGSEEDAILEELGSTAHGIFERVIFTTDAGRRAFAKGFGAEAERIGTATARITPGSLLVCVGRMPLSSITRLLPL